jgi:hypothetical protein
LLAVIRAFKKTKFNSLHAMTLRLVVTAASANATLLV